MPCGARGLVRAVVGRLLSLGPRVRADGRVGVRRLCWPRSHEPGAAAEARPAVSGPGARRVAGRWVAGRRGLAGPGRDCAAASSDRAWTAEAGLAWGVCIVALESGRTAGCLWEDSLWFLLG